MLRGCIPCYFPSPTPPSFLLPYLLPSPPPSSCLAGTWHGRIRSPLKAGTLGKHPRPPVPQPQGAKGVPRFPARWPCFPAAAHPAGLDPALLLLRLLPRLRCCTVNKDSATKNSSVLSQGGAPPSEQRWHRGHPVPHPKPLAQTPSQPSSHTQGCSPIR